MFLPGCHLPVGKVPTPSSINEPSWWEVEYYLLAHSVCFTYSTHHKLPSSPVFSLANAHHTPTHRHTNYICLISYAYMLMFCSVCSSLCIWLLVLGNIDNSTAVWNISTSTRWFDICRPSWFTNHVSTDFSFPLILLLYTFFSKMSQEIYGGLHWADQSYLTSRGWWMAKWVLKQLISNLIYRLMEY